MLRRGVLHVLRWFVALEVFQVAYVPVLFLPPWGGALWGGVLLILVVQRGFMRVLRERPADAARLRMDRLPPRTWVLPGLAAADIVFHWTFSALFYRFNDPMEKVPFEDVFDKPGGIVPAILVIGLVAPLWEELVVRGHLQQPLEKRLGIVSAVAISGAVFALAHLEPERNFPLWITGMVMAYSVIVTGSLWTAVLLHMANNFSAVLLGLIPGDVDDRAFEAWMRSPESIAPITLATLVLALPLAWLLWRLRQVPRGRLLGAAVSEGNIKVNT